MICISLDKNINCEYICKLVSEYVQKNIKTPEQAANTILKLSLVEIKDSDNQIKLI